MQRNKSQKNSALLKISGDARRSRKSKNNTDSTNRRVLSDKNTDIAVSSVPFAENEARLIARSIAVSFDKIFHVLECAGRAGNDIKSLEELKKHRTELTNSMFDATHAIRRFYFAQGHSYYLTALNFAKIARSLSPATPEKINTMDLFNKLWNEFESSISPNLPEKTIHSLEECVKVQIDKLKDAMNKESISVEFMAANQDKCTHIAQQAVERAENALNTLTAFNDWLAVSYDLNHKKSLAA